MLKKVYQFLLKIFYGVITIYLINTFLFKNKRRKKMSFYKTDRITTLPHLLNKKKLEIYTTYFHNLLFDHI